MYMYLIRTAFRLPMRNWNSKRQRFFEIYERAFRLPMRNWNFATGRFQQHRRGRAFRLPMRNWNSGIEGSPFQFVSLSDYLWGIETTHLGCSWKLFCSFQTTYEELKPDTGSTDDTVSLLSDYLWGIETSFKSHSHQLQRKERFQTTYEELKQLKLEGVPLPQKSFQTTYEELKPIEVAKVFGGVALSDYLWGIETVYLEDGRELYGAFRLPMRNWNPNLSKRCSTSTALSDYLWGIETFHSSRSCSRDQRAFRLPMRNWNSPKTSGSQWPCK